MCREGRGSLALYSIGILCVDGAAGGCEGVQGGAWLPGSGQAPIRELLTWHPRRLQEEARVQSRKSFKILLIVDAMFPTGERYILKKCCRSENRDLVSF